MEPALEEKVDVAFEVNKVWYKSVAISLGLGAAVALATYKANKHMVQTTFDGVTVHNAVPPKSVD